MLVVHTGCTAAKLRESYSLIHHHQLKHTQCAGKSQSTCFVPTNPPRCVDLSLPPACPTLQSAAILKAEIYGIPRPEWAASALKCGAAAATVPVEPFAPRKGVVIETDPKAKGAPAVHQDDESVIEQLLESLQASTASLAAGFRLSPIQVCTCVAGSNSANDRKGLSAILGWSIGCLALASLHQVLGHVRPEGVCDPRPIVILLWHFSFVCRMR